MILFEKFHFYINQGIENILFHLPLHEFGFYLEFTKQLALLVVLMHLWLFFNRPLLLTNYFLSILISQLQVKELASQLKIIIQISPRVLVCKNNLVVLLLNVTIHFFYQLLFFEQKLIFVLGKLLN